MNLDELWKLVLTHQNLQQKVNLQSFNLWLKDTEAFEITGSVIRIKVEDDVARDMIQKNYSDILDRAVSEISGKSYRCEFVPKNMIMSQQKTESPVMKEEKNTPSIQETSLYPEYTFDNFVVGPNNQFAYNAALGVANNPATNNPLSKINPLFIYGESGMGKTHLLQAIGHKILKENPYLKVKFISTEKFTSDFIYSLQKNTMESFKIMYRNVDVLLIDDIQFLSGKEETQNEFFHTFNDLHQNHKQIVISSDKPPKQIATLTERLRTRFEWGMITDIKPPELETREAILKNKAEKLNIKLTDDACYFIAKRIKSSIRALESAVNRLQFISEMTHSEITTEQARVNLKELFDVDSDKKITVSDIISKISEKYDLSQAELKSSSRSGKLITPRFTAMYLTKKLTEMTMAEIGDAFGGRDHSTVVNAIKKTEDAIKTDLSFKDQIDDIISELKS